MSQYNPEYFISDVSFFFLILTGVIKDSLGRGIECGWYKDLLNDELMIERVDYST